MFLRQDSDLNFLMDLMMDLWADEVDAEEGDGGHGEGGPHESSGAVPALMAPPDHAEEGPPPEQHEERDACELSQHDVLTDEQVQRYFNRVDAEEHEEPLPDDVYDEMTQYYQPQDDDGARPAKDAQVDEYPEAPASSLAVFDTQVDAEGCSGSETPATALEEALGETTEPPSNPSPALDSSKHAEAPKPSPAMEALDSSKHAETPKPTPAMETLDSSKHAEAPKPTPAMEALDSSKHAEAPKPTPAMEALDSSNHAEAPKPTPAMEALDSTKHAEAPKPTPAMETLDSSKHAEAPKPSLVLPEAPSTPAPEVFSVNSEASKAPSVPSAPPMAPTAPSIPTSSGPSKKTFEITRASSSHKKGKNAEILAKMQALQRLDFSL